MHRNRLIRPATTTLAFSLALAGCQHLDDGTSGGTGTTAAQPNTSNAGSPGMTSGGGTAGDGSGVAPVDDAFVSQATCSAEGLAAPLDFVSPYVADPAVRQEVAEVLGRMTIDDKVIQLTGIERPDPVNYVDIQRSRDDEVNNIKGYLYRDGPHGLNLESGPQLADATDYATSFPVNVSRGASFDMDLEYRLGQAMGDETLASQNTMLLGPCMNVLRHPYWGRAQETYGEDVFHLGRIATAYTIGLQEFVAGCAKHYIANNIEENRFNLDSVMDEQTLREIYSRHFEMVVEDGGVACIMAAYNSVNNVKSTQDKHILTEVLRDDYGFEGFVLTDWWAMPGPSRGQGPTNPPDDLNYTAAALEAGLDVEVPWALNFDSIPALVADDASYGALVDQSVSRVLEQKVRFNIAYMDTQPLGLKTPTTTYTQGGITDNDHHVALAQEAAERGMVLLKNEGDVLPISADVKKVAVIGAVIPFTVKSDNPADQTMDFVNQQPLGDRGSSRVRPNPAQITAPLAGITEAAGANITVVSGASAADVGDADFVVVVAGLTPGEEGEEYTGAGDRTSLTLGAVQDGLIADVAALGKPMVVIIEAGGVVDMPWLGSVPAVVMAWYPGQKGGAAMGRLLFGQTNFGAKLPVTWPTDVSQFPVFNEGRATTMEYYVGYRRFDRDGLVPLFAFGHGLSYSDLAIDALELPCEPIEKTATFDVTVNVTNSSAMDGDEVVFVFASYPGTTARRPIKELKGFARVKIPANSSVPVKIPVRVDDLKYWDDTTGAWVVETGEVRLHVGNSSDNLLLAGAVQIVD